MSQRRTLQTIAAYTRLILAPAVDSLAPWLGVDPSPLTRKVIGCATTIDGIDLAPIVTSLAEQRRQAAAGRPRGESSGRSGGITNPTMDTATELYRIRECGLRLQEAIDRLHPDPEWPSIASGRRTSTATEHLAATIDEIRCGEPADLSDAVDALVLAVQELQKAARAARAIRAWTAPRTPLSDVDPPDAILEAARCTSWPLGRDKDGEQVRCGNYRGAHGHRHPESGTHHHDDLCDDCYRLVCAVCWSRPRRTAGSKECMTCEVRIRRMKVA